MKKYTLNLNLGRHGRIMQTIVKADYYSTLVEIGLLGIFVLIIVLALNL